VCGQRGPSAPTCTSIWPTSCGKAILSGPVPAGDRAQHPRHHGSTGVANLTLPAIYRCARGRHRCSRSEKEGASTSAGPSIRTWQMKPSAGPRGAAAPMDACGRRRRGRRAAWREDISVRHRDAAVPSSAYSAGETARLCRPGLVSWSAGHPLLRPGGRRPGPRHRGTPTAEYYPYEGSATPQIASPARLAGDQPGDAGPQDPPPGSMSSARECKETRKRRLLQPSAWFVSGARGRRTAYTADRRG